MQRIHFVFPQTADTIFNLIRFQDTTCLRILLVACPFLSSVSRGVNHELVAYVFFVVAAATWQQNKCVYYTYALHQGVIICECYDYYS